MRQTRYSFGINLPGCRQAPYMSNGQKTSNHMTTIRFLFVKPVKHFLCIGLKQA